MDEKKEIIEEELPMEESAEEIPEEPTAEEPMIAEPVVVADPMAEVKEAIAKLDEKLEKVYQTVQLFVAAGANITDDVIEDAEDISIADFEDLVDPDELDLKLD